jgi:hypothetical protein
MEPSDNTVNRLIIQLRAYVEGRRKKSWETERSWTSGITVTFDTEITTDPSQRLRFGACQVRDRGELLERGVFHVEDMPRADLKVLRASFDEEVPTDAGERLRFLSRSEFVEEVIFKWGLDGGGLIVGFNLPFDLSRIAISHTYAKETMKGGFSFTLAEGRPNVRIKHLPQRAAFINFGGKDGDDKDPDRGFFVDVKTLAATLTSRSHSLQSLTKLLGTTPKSPLESYDGALTPKLVRYGMNDVQATWECFTKLAERYDAYGLATGLYDLYSEASLGKAFLEAMNIRPWRRAQPKFPPRLIGQIMSTYYGGRAGVHIRREITPVIHRDFMSMYPTVCTLMGLWRFVIAGGVEWKDATNDVRRFVDECSVEDLRLAQTWTCLHSIVQGRPNDDIFPVRAVYELGQAANIGVNRLRSGEPTWFTLADVLAAKVLGGKAPEIVAAIRFAPYRPQSGLRPIALERIEVQPEVDDFYKLLIDQRQRIQAAEKVAAEEEKPKLASAQQSLKILANSTGYGIFVELNVEHLDKPDTLTCYDFRGVGRKMSTSKRERTGRYFHPLLATLITGAARLMSALAERHTLDQGLDWAFCDTDSLAMANTTDLPTAEFIRRAEAVRAWFEPLNPYSETKGSILQLEKVNFPVGQDGVEAQLRPTNCLAISAKRSVLFDRDENGRPVIRKASAHGLGHILPPYPDPERPARIDRIGVELWQEEPWLAIIDAFDAGHPDEVDFTGMRNFDEPAASRYAATNQTLLKWFETYNGSVEARDQVWPFNFLLSFQVKSRIEMAAVDPDALSSPAWRRRHPNPASRYSSDLLKDRPPVFDRKTGEPIPRSWLKSYGRTVVRHHLHSELKFSGGADDQRGLLRRRQVEAWAVIPIGKEADNLEEREVLGDDDESVEWSMAMHDRRKLAADIEETLKTCRLSDAALLRRANVSHHTLGALRNGGRVMAQSLLSLARAAEELRQEAQSLRSEQERWRQIGLGLMERVGGRNRLAKILKLSTPYLGRIIRGEKAMTKAVMNRLNELQRSVVS